MKHRSLAEHQAAEVAWYAKHGKYQQHRIVIDAHGCAYVIGDASWNRKHPGRPEYIEREMYAETERPTP